MIWQLAAPREDLRFARPLRVGTWSSGTLCSVCGASTEERVPPLVLEWDLKGEFGDFSWPAFNDEIVVKKNTFYLLKTTAPYLKFEQLKLIIAPGVERVGPDTINGVAKLEAQLVNLLVDVEVEADLDFSSIEVEQPCEGCGRQGYFVSGIEYDDFISTPGTEEWGLRKVPREPGKGLFVKRENVASSPIFKITQFSGSFYCLSEFKDFVVSKKLNNIKFREVGELF